MDKKLFAEQLAVFTTGWKHINTGMHTFELNRQQLYDAILTANKILQP